MKKVLVRGPALSMSGYGEQTRFALRALQSREDLFDLYLVNTKWGQTGWLWEDSKERIWLDYLINKTVEHGQSGGQFDISLQVTIPNEWQKLAPVNIGYTAGIECDKVSPVWIQQAALMDRIIVVSNHAKDVFNSTAFRLDGSPTVFKNNVPIEVVNYPVKEVEPERANFEFLYDFNFLTVCQWGPRKNLENTIKYFLDEFYEDEVGLVIKTSVRNNSLIDRMETSTKIGAIIGANSKPGIQRKCKVHLIHGDMSEGEMTSLYRHPRIKALLSLTHGEGFGLPIFEAAYNGLPILAPAWSGHCDFLYMMQRDNSKKKSKKKNTAMFLPIEFELKEVQEEAVWKGVIEKGSKWCFPIESKVKNRMRTMIMNYDSYKSKAEKLQTHIKENFTEKFQYEQFVNGIISLEEQNSFKEEVDRLLENLL